MVLKVRPENSCPNNTESARTGEPVRLGRLPYH